MPDLLAEFYPPVRQLEVDEDVVVGEGLPCPHALGDDVPGRSRAPVGDTEDIGAIFLLSCHMNNTLRPILKTSNG